jgi:predicted DNA-binding antitoxin AbrB/MazE fold protein
MRQRVDAVYENGVLRPLEPLELSDHERVCVTVESVGLDIWLDLDVVEWAASEADASIPLDDVRSRLSTFSGSLSELIIAERGDF